MRTLQPRPECPRGRVRGHPVARDRADSGGAPAAPPRIAAVGHGRGTTGAGVGSRAEREKSSGDAALTCVDAAFLHLQTPQTRSQRGTMPECSGREILTEVFSHLGRQDDLPTRLERAYGAPCRLPHTTSQFMPHTPGDRAPVTPPGTGNQGFVGQYCETPGNVVHTVEDSVHSTALAVASLLGTPEAVSPAYHGLDPPHALVGAIRRLLA